MNFATEPFGSFDLVKVAGVIVINLGPEKRTQAAERSVRPRIYGCELPRNADRELRAKTVIDHFLPGRGNQIEGFLRHCNSRGYHAGAFGARFQFAPAGLPNPFACGIPVTKKLAQR